MTTLYRSKKGDVNTKEAWIKWLEQFYKQLGCDYDHNTKPKDAWERAVRILKLKPIDKEEYESIELTRLINYSVMPLGQLEQALSQGHIIEEHQSSAFMDFGGKSVE